MQLGSSNLTEMFQDESLKPIYFRVRRSKVKVTVTKTLPAWVLHSCECWLLLRYNTIRYGYGIYVRSIADEMTRLNLAHGTETKNKEKLKTKPSSSSFFRDYNSRTKDEILNTGALLIVSAITAAVCSLSVKRQSLTQSTSAVSSGPFLPRHLFGRITLIWRQIENIQRVALCRDRLINPGEVYRARYSFTELDRDHGWGVQSCWLGACRPVMDRIAVIAGYVVEMGIEPNLNWTRTPLDAYAKMQHLSQMQHGLSLINSELVMHWHNSLAALAVFN